MSFVDSAVQRWLPGRNLADSSPSPLLTLYFSPHLSRFSTSLSLFRLPLSRIYSSYFGGSLDLVTMHGWGTDVYCVLRVV